MDVNIEIIKSWNMYGQYIAIALFGIGALILLVYLGRLFSFSQPKDKYDFINKSEISSLWGTAVAIIIASAIIANTFIGDITVLWLFVRVFLTVMISVIAGVVFNNILKFYYPFYIEKRLKKLRYKPRISPKSGKPMTLLTEAQEDVYLDEGMQAEENVFSVDYDVWRDEENDLTHIEKYDGHLHAHQCPDCNYQTFKVVKEEIITPSTHDEEGETLKYFECGYCGHKSKRSFKIAKIKDELQKA